jgi:hypothetical protein
VVDLGAGDGFIGAGETPQRINVQCESCHGRGGDHVSARLAGAPFTDGKMTRVLPKSCNVCHDCVHDPQFSYTPFWEKIKHGAE